MRINTRIAAIDALIDGERVDTIRCKTVIGDHTLSSPYYPPKGHR